VTETLGSTDADTPQRNKLPRDEVQNGSLTDLPVTGREVFAVLLLVVLSDLTVYRSEGFAAAAALFVAAPLLLWVGTARREAGWATFVVALLLNLAAIKLIWCGSWLLVACGWGLLFAFSMTLAGACPYVLETLVFASQTVRSGYEGLSAYGRVLERRTDSQQRSPWLNVGLPLMAVLGFGTIFILANPDLVTLVSRRLEAVVQTLRRWLGGFAFWEVVFWVLSLWMSVGLIRPYVGRGRRAAAADDTRGPRPIAAVPLYEAFRNTLLAVIGLFAVYLVFEFSTLWFGHFPREFFYSGRVHKYAHEGAAWLTLALALATVVLSLIFRSGTLGDPRLPALKRLAWLWSLQNGLLAITVYHRLLIYIGFNGMSRMRLVGLFGITCVVVGFVLVLWKIAFHKRFAWLLRRHLWTVAAAVYLFALIPVDAIIHRYNVSRILAGDSAPSVQISVQPMNAEGYLMLPALLHADDAAVREGVRAMLAEQLRASERLARQRRQLGWSTLQIADRQLLAQLRRLEPQLQPYADDARRAEALERFHEYAYQWY
jgi:hypothetical protein